MFCSAFTRPLAKVRAKKNRDSMLEVPVRPAERRSLDNSGAAGSFVPAQHSLHDIPHIPHYNRRRNKIGKQPNRRVVSMPVFSAADVPDLSQVPQTAASPNQGQGQGQGQLVRTSWLPVEITTKPLPPSPAAKHQANGSDSIAASSNYSGGYSSGYSGCSGEYSGGTNRAMGANGSANGRNDRNDSAAWLASEADLPSLGPVVRSNVGVSPDNNRKIVQNEATPARLPLQTPPLLPYLPSSSRYLSSSRIVSAPPVSHSGSRDRFTSLAPPYLQSPRGSSHDLLDGYVTATLSDSPSTRASDYFTPAGYPVFGDKLNLSQPGSTTSSLDLGDTLDNIFDTYMSLGSRASLSSGASTAPLAVDSGVLNMLHHVKSSSYLAGGSMFGKCDSLFDHEEAPCEPILEQSTAEVSPAISPAVSPAVSHTVAGTVPGGTVHVAAPAPAPAPAQEAPRRRVVSEQFTSMPYDFCLDYGADYVSSRYTVPDKNRTLSDWYSPQNRRYSRQYTAYKNKSLPSAPTHEQMVKQKQKDASQNRRVVSGPVHLLGPVAANRHSYNEGARPRAGPVYQVKTFVH